MKYRILLKKIIDILSIPINIVAYESTFSARERVTNRYRSKLDVNIMQALICGSNWVCSYYGLKLKMKVKSCIFYICQ